MSKAKNRANNTGRRKGDSGAKNGANGRRRVNNTGTLEKRGNRWLARWYIYTPQGKRVRQSKMLNATTLDGARAELKELTEGNALITREKMLERNKVQMEGVKAELQRYEDSRPALALTDMWDAFARDPNRPQCGAATLSRYEAQVARFVDWVAANYPDAREVREISRDVAAAFLADLSANVSPNTYNKYASLLRLVWATISEQARCTANPWQGVKRKEQPKTNGRRALTVEELAKVTRDLEGEMRLLFAIGIYTGLRLGDCAMLDWGAVDLVRRVIVTTPRKTARKGKVVEIPLHPVLAAMLAETPPERRTGYVLPDSAATYRRDDSALTKRVRAVFERAGIATTKQVDGYSQAVAQVGFHSLRHSFVSLMGNAGAPLALVQSIVGHTNPMMTAHYFHARTDALANAVAALPEIIAIDAQKTPLDATDAQGDATLPPDACAPSSPILARFSALLAEMSPGERAQAATILANYKGATH